jgi:hypothetical protein
MLLALSSARVTRTRPWNKRASHKTFSMLKKFITVRRCRRTRKTASTPNPPCKMETEYKVPFSPWNNNQFQTRIAKLEENSRWVNDLQTKFTLSRSPPQGSPSLFYLMAVTRRRQSRTITYVTDMEGKNRNPKGISWKPSQILYTCLRSPPGGLTDLLNFIAKANRGRAMPPGHPLSLNLDTLAFSSYNMPNFVETYHTFETLLHKQRRITDEQTWRRS